MTNLMTFNGPFDELKIDLTENLSSDMAYTLASVLKFIGLCNFIKSSLLICEIRHNLE